jgi:hypothetical protein
LASYSSLAALGSFSLIRSITDESVSVVTSPSWRLSADVAQQPAHDLAGPGLGQLRHDHDLPRPGDLADLLGHVLAQLLDQRLAGRLVLGDRAADDDERDDALTGGRVASRRRPPPRPPSDG